jgi:hypothetical protein
LLARVKQRPLTHVHPDRPPTPALYAAVCRSAPLCTALHFRDLALPYTSTRRRWRLAKKALPLALVCSAVLGVSLALWWNRGGLRLPWAGTGAGKEQPQLQARLEGGEARAGTQ